VPESTISDGAGAPEIDVTRLRVAIARVSRRLRRHELAGITPSQLAALAAALPALETLAGAAPGARSSERH
jgi:hypothetical protein